MVKSTATQQQDTISDIKSPKSCTAGIYMKRENMELGSAWAADLERHQARKSYLEEHMLISVMVVSKPSRYRAELDSGTGDIVLDADKGRVSSVLEQVTDSPIGQASPACLCAGGEGRKMVLAVSLSVRASGRKRKPKTPKLQYT